jgi:hypothetical protein
MIDAGRRFAAPPGRSSRASRDLTGVERALRAEQGYARDQDRLYREPLKRELEQLRHRK